MTQDSQDRCPAFQFGSTDLRCGQIPRAMLQIYAKQHVSQYKIPVWKLLHQTLYNHWPCRLAHGREVYVVQLDHIGSPVFASELIQQLRSRGKDIDPLGNETGSMFRATSK